MNNMMAAYETYLQGFRSGTDLPMSPEPVAAYDRAAIIVETRPDPLLPAVIANFRWFLGDEWNVYLVNPDAPGHEWTGHTPGIPINRETYSAILKRTDFWTHFHEETLLIFQLDCLCLRPLEERFLAYDFIGAPCGGESQIYNGGLSLRRRSAMLAALDAPKPDWEHAIEDVFFTRALRDLGARLPSLHTAAEFALETDYVGPPFGVHGTDKRFHSAELAEHVVLEAILEPDFRFPAEVKPQSRTGASDH